MLFHSTRGNDSGRKFSDIVMQGLASDGGLFMPDAWPQIKIEDLQESDSFLDVAKKINLSFKSASEDTREIGEVGDRLATSKRGGIALTLTFGS